MNNLNHKNGISPFYFGSPEKRLFGCFHAPRARAARNCGVILCYPMGQEYIRSHRSFHQLAERLVQSGFPVLRFDYYGCGDSSGDDEDGHLQQWNEDIASAITEMQQRTGLAKVCLVGLRLGGTLALLAAADRGDVDGIVLWDPIISGQEYLEEVSGFHQDRLQNFPARLDNRNDKQQSEVLGFPLSDLIRTELARINLLNIKSKPANQLLLITSNSENRLDEFAERLNRLGVATASQQLDSPMVWIENVNKVLVPHQALQAIVTWLSQAYR